MDLLGSILGKMDAPPAAQVDEETKKKVRGSNLNKLLIVQIWNNFLTGFDYWNYLNFTQDVYWQTFKESLPQIKMVQ